MSRKELTDAIKYAPAAGDLKTCTRLYVEHRISRAAYDLAVETGRSMAKRIGSAA